MTPVLAATLILQLHNLAGVPAPVLTTAASELTRVYEAMGMHVGWDRTMNDRGADPEIVPIVLLADETGDLRRGDTVMGAAMHTPEGTRVVYVFYRQVRAEAERYSVSTAIVLACAMAHELGHLLMPGYGHSAEGLMRACWRADDFHRADQGQLRFSADQVAVMRRSFLSEPFVEHERGDRARE
jgi:hypothetical protein